jgi:hypothetical protein
MRTHTDRDTARASGKLPAVERSGTVRGQQIRRQARNQEGRLQYEAMRLRIFVGDVKDYGTNASHRDPGTIGNQNEHVRHGFVKTGSN